MKLCFRRIIFLHGHYDNTYAIAYGCANAADKIEKNCEGVSDNIEKTFAAMPPR